MAFMRTHCWMPHDGAGAPAAPLHITDWKPLLEWGFTWTFGAPPTVTQQCALLVFWRQQPSRPARYSVHCCSQDFVLQSPRFTSPLLYPQNCPKGLALNPEHPAPGECRPMMGD